MSTTPDKYAAQREAALAWLGERYLLAERQRRLPTAQPVPRTTVSLPPMEFERS